ncbi:putative 3-oxolaurate decarboxylase [Rosa chinensis]|uniref:(S)-hydroxynitrile lyase n=1 Tax=Rosa chinensis TaxID=74649 RepID=A0A2P6SB80_ROSCH|nr:probable esterase PIR7A [Rosa chinensis]PRQ55921.1 putative 3-oxolaurate decarboxylase [Rosa chinensis]
MDQIVMRMREKHFMLFVLFLCLLLPIFTSSSPSPPHSYNPTQNPVAKKHFVLVHGAGHGAWCWYKVATLLKQSGHNVTTLDLAASGIDPTQIQQVRSFAVYVEPLTNFVESLPPKERVVLVGHSLGGVALSITMERFPQKISVAVFATAAMPGPDISFLTILQEFSSHLDFMDSQYRFDDGATKPATSVLLGPKVLASSFYQLSPPEDLTLAVTLVRFAPLITEELKFTKHRYGSVRKVYILCDQDHAIKVDLAMLMINKNPPDEVKVINGSDHMVMLSRPVELFSNILQIAEKYS